MDHNEVIVVSNVPQDVFAQIAVKAVRYALISVGFTYNRMDKTDLVSRISNITKGKIAEEIFYYYSEQHGIRLDTLSCATPYWLPDLRDFLWLGGEWDIKNNFFYCSDHDFETFPFIHLPALIPNKYYGDQWNRSNETYHNQSKFTAYLFTFMRLLPDKKQFFSLNLTDRQLQFIAASTIPPELSSYETDTVSESWFYAKMKSLGSDRYIKVNYQPELIITACANARYWSLFKDTSYVDNMNYNDFLPDGNWYQSAEGVLKFMNDAIITKIKNKTCPISLLPSFSGIINKVKTSLAAK